MKPVFEYLAFAYQLIEKFRLIIAYPRPQYMMMRTLDDGDRIDLNITEMFDRSQCCLFTSAEVICFE